MLIRQQQMTYFDEDRRFEKLVRNHRMWICKQYRSETGILALTVLLQKSKELLVLFLLSRFVSEKSGVKLQVGEDQPCTILDDVQYV